MATSDSPSSSLSFVPSLSASKKENLSMTKSKLDELMESRSEISNRIQNLKQDLQNWRTKLETQVKSHREELTELRKSLEVEVTQLKSEFQGLRTTLQQQQEDVTASLRNMGLQDPPKDAQTASSPQIDDDSSSIEARHKEASNDKSSDKDSPREGIEAEIIVPSP
ncbi:hypothetical protein RND81_12G061600 [Saponaria officinalis]|uniref:CAP-Gly domain-containing linker protein 1-like n=1 Tax=Saponaria officinalis TaxID=3572 RepID=A0AAW1H5N4_SAPOF